MQCQFNPTESDGKVGMPSLAAAVEPRSSRGGFSFERQKSALEGKGTPRAVEWDSWQEPTRRYPASGDGEMTGRIGNGVFPSQRKAVTHLK
jgi:hypothetical protein